MKKITLAALKPHSATSAIKEGAGGRLHNPGAGGHYGAGSKLGEGRRWGQSLTLILKVEPTGLADTFDVDVEEKEYEIVSDVRFKNWKLPFAVGGAPVKNSVFDVQNLRNIKRHGDVV